MKTRVYIFFIIILAILVNFQCSNKSAGLQVIALIDFSGSIEAEQTKYLSMLREGLIANLSEEDIITIIPIDAASETKCEIIGQCELNKFKKKVDKQIGQFDRLKISEKKELLFKSYLDTLFESNIKQFRVSRKEFINLTDILGAVKQVKPYWKNNDERKKLLFIFSDMIQESADVNFTNLNSVTEIDTIIDFLNQNRLIPELNSIEVFICGATTKDTKKYRIYKEFWETYFSNSGAKLLDYGYGNYNRIKDFLSDRRTLNKD